MGHGLECKRWSPKCTCKGEVGTIPRESRKVLTIFLIAPLHSSIPSSSLCMLVYKYKEPKTTSWKLLKFNGTLTISPNGNTPFPLRLGPLIPQSLKILDRKHKFPPSWSPEVKVRRPYPTFSPWFPDPCILSIVTQYDLMTISVMYILHPGAQKASPYQNWQAPLQSAKGSELSF
jgi:hypothetical protein